MIELTSRFGRSAFRNVFTFTLVVVIICCSAGEAFTFGISGLYATKLKIEHQYSDYTRYHFPQIEGADSVRYEYVDPYIANFPENRSLAKITQSLGPMTTAELRYEKSLLTSDKSQDRYFVRLDHQMTDLTTLYGSFQYLGIAYDSPDSSTSTGYMTSLGVKYDRAGWIKGEAGFSFDYNRSSSDLLTRTYLPMLSLRWSINRVTALSARWDGYFSENEEGSYPSHAFSVFISRYLPTQTAVHLFARYYTSSEEITSISPSVEVAQYIFWNLTFRMTYRYYQNSFNSEDAPEFIEGDSLASHAIRAYVEWQALDALKIHIKLRHYQSDQKIEMNTYLLGLEYEL